jgi:hypothetical protein
MRPTSSMAVRARPPHMQQVAITITLAKMAISLAVKGSLFISPLVEC